MHALIECLRLANYSVDGGGCSGISYFASLATVAAEVSWSRLWMERSACPARTAARLSRIGRPILRQLATMEKIAATLGPACLRPMCIQLRGPVCK